MSPALKKIYIIFLRGRVSLYLGEGQNISLCGTTTGNCQVGLCLYLFQTNNMHYFLVLVVACIKCLGQSVCLTVLIPTLKICYSSPGLRHFSFKDLDGWNNLSQPVPQMFTSIPQLAGSGPMAKLTVKALAPVIRYIHAYGRTMASLSSYQVTALFPKFFLLQFTRIILILNSK